MTPDKDGWIEWHGGECPIPDAKAGEYELILYDHQKFAPSHSSAIIWPWFAKGTILSYRLLPKEVV